jgi:hypothetical protein
MKILFQKERFFAFIILSSIKSFKMKLFHVLSIIFLTFITTKSFGQNQYYIDGSREVCVGQCVTYTPMIDNMNITAIEYVNVQLLDSPDSQQCSKISYGNEDKDFEVCFFCPGTYSVSGFFIVDNGRSFFDSIFVNVNGPQQLSIIEIDSLQCGREPGFECDNVCAGSTRKYKIINPGVTNITWDVQGATTFTAINDEITVTWGNGQSGSITAYSSGVGLCDSPGYRCFYIKEIVPTFSLPKKEICVHETMELIPDNLTASVYEWDFGNGEKSTDIKPIVFYDEPGTYTIQLNVRDECGCIGSFTREIIVKDLYLPTIDCKSTICENTPMTYHTDADCGSFFWKVIGDGKVTAGGGTSDKFISVDWGDGPLGIIELEVSGCNFDLCPQKAVFDIPIISDKALIVGKSIVCQNAREIYTVQKYGATSYHWQVDGGTITAGQGSNSIIVDWTSNSVGSLRVDFDNCYLKCNGSTSTNVNIKPTYRLSTADRDVCIGDVITVQALNNLNIPTLVENWQIKSGTGSLLATETNKASISYTVPPSLDKIIIQTATQSYCDGDQSVSIHILPKSKIVMGIEGETNICKDIDYLYKAKSDLVNASFEWQITDGNNEYTISGKDIIVQWKTMGPYKLEVAQLDLNGNYCISDGFSIILNDIPSMVLTAEPESCIYDHHTITAPVFEGMTYQWSLLDENAGTIIQSDSQRVEVIWSKTGVQTVTLNTCAGTFSTSIIVHALPEPIVVYPQALCEDKQINLSTTLIYNAYVWSNFEGSKISDLADPSVFSGTYAVEVTDNNGCKGKENFTIDLLPKPNIFLSTPDDTGVCLTTGSPYPLLYALDAEDGYTYRWFFDDVLQATTNNTFQTNAIGKYNVEITDAFGCTNLSNSEIVYDRCDVNSPTPGPGGGVTIKPCNTAGNSDFSFNSLDCNSYTFLNESSGHTGMDDQWFFGDLGETDYTNITQPVHHFSNAGFFRVDLLTGFNDVNNPGQLCYKWTRKVVEVPVKASFDFNNGCQGEDIQFYDRTTFIPGKDVVSWSWDFGDPASGLANFSSLPDPIHQFSSDGQFIVKLIVSNGTCTDEIMQVITLHKKPLSTFTFPDGACENINTKIVLDSLDDSFFRVDWEFGDITSADNNVQIGLEGFHTYEQSGTYQIKTDIETIFGCKNTLMTSINIAKNTLSGNIISSEGDKFCEGQVSVLSAPSNGVSWLWNTAETTSGIQITQAGIYQVTMTNSDGCTFIPDQLVIQINPAPKSAIGVEVYDDQESKLFFEPSISFCRGKNVKVFTTAANDYTYEWNTGFQGKVLEYSNILNNVLIAGVYEFSLKTTDKVTGCTSISDKRNVNVNRFDGNIQITSATLGTMCEGIKHQLQLTNIIPNVQYQWSNGKKTNAIITDIGGTYFVTARDGNGCEARSNELNIFLGPDASLVPSGCFERCGADTLCFPTIQGVSKFQWLNGDTEIASANGGQQPYIILTESGSYTLELTGTNGCISLSEPLTLDIKDRVGVIKGNVYADVNANNIIDSQDTLLSGIKVDIAGASSISNSLGQFLMENVPAGDYFPNIDPSLLIGGSKAIIDSILAQIKFCDDTVHVDLLVGFDCFGKTDVLDFRVCYGQSITLIGSTFTQDTILNILKTNSQGCIDTSRYFINFTPEIQFSSESIMACPGQSDGKILVTSPNKDDYTYSLDNTFISLTNGNIPDLKADQYVIKVKDKFGCYIERTIQIDEKPSLEFALDHTNISCATGNATLRLASSNYNFDQLNLLWSNGNTGQEIIVSNKGTYTLKIENGCETLEKSAIVDGYAYQHQYRKFIVCNGKSYELLGKQYSKDTILFTTLVNNEGCIDTTTYELKFGLPFTHVLDINGHCPGKADGEIRILNDAPTGRTYLLNGNMVTVDSGIISNLQAGDYTLQVKDELGCEQKTLLTITEKEEIEYRIQYEDISCFKGYAAAKVDLLNYDVNDISVKWSNGSNDIATQILTPGKVSLELSNGCYVTNESIDIRTTDKTPDFKLPHLFNPGLTGAQPLIDLGITDLATADVLGLAVFDRVGRMVFTSKELVWDATSILPDGLYYYRIEATVDVCGKSENVVRSGTFTLIK